MEVNNLIMREKLTKKTLILGVVGLVAIGAGSAAVLDYIGQTEGEVNVQSAITMNDGTETSAEANYGSDKVSGDLLMADAQTLENVGSSILDLSFTANESIVYSDGNVNESDPDGVDTSFLVYSQKERTANGYDVEDSQYAVDVTPVTENVQNGEYATQISSNGETNDYATIWYDVEDASNASFIEYYADSSSDSDVPGSDELYILTESGEVYVEASSNGQYEESVAENSSGTVIEPLDDAVFTVDEDANTQEVNPDEYEIAAVGIGYGNGNPDDTGRRVNVTIDNVRLTASNDGDTVEQLSETEQDISSLPMLPTTEETAPFGTIRYQYQSVTSLDNGFFTEDGNSLRVESTVQLAE
mgnify:FL=1